MKSQHSVLALAAVSVITLALAGSGCIFSPQSTPGTQLQYDPPSTPYNVINNLRKLYINRDVAKYDATLSADYVFRFVPDPYTNAQDSLSRPEEYNFAEHLFVSGSSDKQEQPASSIKLTIDTTSSSPDIRAGHDGWMRYYVQTNLSITEASGVSHTVVGPAVFFLKQEPANSGTWKLAEWDDQPTSNAPSRTVPTSQTVAALAPRR